MRVLNKSYWPYTITLRSPTDANDIEEWLKSAIGRRFKEYYSYSLDRNIVTYGFKDEESLLVFKLKWKQNEKII